MPLPEVYRSLPEYLMQRIPDAWDTGLTNLIFLMMGIFHSRSLLWNWVARKTPIRAQKLSIVKRLTRFLDHGAVRVREGDPPFAETRRRSAAKSRPGPLMIDTTKVAFGFRLGRVSLADRRRSMPLAWTGA